MKQHITQQQHEELSPAARIAYIEWTLKQGDPAHSYRSISDLIQFIDEYINAGQWAIERGKMSGFWVVRTRHLAFSTQSELVDALWEAVAMLLENRESDDE